MNWNPRPLHIWPDEPYAIACPSLQLVLNITGLKETTYCTLQFGTPDKSNPNCWKSQRASKCPQTALFFLENIPAPWTCTIQAFHHNSDPPIGTWKHELYSDIRGKGDCITKTHAIENGGRIIAEFSVLNSLVFPVLVDKPGTRATSKPLTVKAFPELSLVVYQVVDLPPLQKWDHIHCEVFLKTFNLDDKTKPKPISKNILKTHPSDKIPTPFWGEEGKATFHTRLDALEFHVIAEKKGKDKHHHSWAVEISLPELASRACSSESKFWVKLPDGGHLAVGITALSDFLSVETLPSGTGSPPDRPTRVNPGLASESSFRTNKRNTIASSSSTELGGRKSRFFKEKKISYDSLVVKTGPETPLEHAQPVASVQDHFGKEAQRQLTQIQLILNDAEEHKTPSKSLSPRKISSNQISRMTIDETTAVAPWMGSTDTTSSDSPKNRVALDSKAHRSPRSPRSPRTKVTSDEDQNRTEVKTHRPPRTSKAAALPTSDETEIKTLKSPRTTKTAVSPTSDEEQPTKPRRSSSSKKVETDGGTPPIQRKPSTKKNDSGTGEGKDKLNSKRRAGEGGISEAGSTSRAKFRSEKSKTSPHSQDAPPNDFISPRRSQHLHAGISRELLNQIRAETPSVSELDLSKIKKKPSSNHLDVSPVISPRRSISPNAGIPKEILEQAELQMRARSKSTESSDGSSSAPLGQRRSNPASPRSRLSPRLPPLQEEKDFSGLVLACGGCSARTPAENLTIIDTRSLCPTCVLLYSR